MGSPVLLAHLSDLHLRAGADGALPAARLQRVVGLLDGLRPRPLAVLLTGDLADDGSPEAYQRAHELLAPLELPLHAIPGNHDDRVLLRARFGQLDGPAERVNVAFDCGELRVVGIDTMVPGSDAGALGEEQLDWLRRALARAPARSTLLALHHPPVLTGIEAMDEIALDSVDSAALEALLEDSPQVRSVICGHVHSAMSTSFARRPLLVCPSTNSAVRLDLRAGEGVPFATTDGPLGFTVHSLVDGRLVSHLQPVAQPAG